MTNINTKFRHLTIECDALLENNQNIFSEKEDLEALVNRLRAANEEDSKTIQDLEQQLHEVDTMRLQLNALEAQNNDCQEAIPRLEECLQVVGLPSMHYRRIRTNWRSSTKRNLRTKKGWNKSWTRLKRV